MGEKLGIGFMVAVAAVVVGAVLRSGWDDAKKQAQEAANPTVRWTDKNRWE